MNLFRYNNFLLESQLTQLLLEAEVRYFQDFKEILHQMKSPVAQELLNLEDKDLKITTNYLNLGDKDDEVTFYAPNAKNTKYQILDPGYTFTSYTDLFRAAGLEGDEYPSLPQFTTGEVKHIFEPGLEPNSTSRRIAHFVSDNGKNCFINMNGLQPIPSGKPQKTSIGRVARRMLEVAGKKFTDKELEDFVNEFKFRISIKKDRTQLFELVGGELIKFWYHHTRYDYKKEGTLHGSCMRYNKCQNYFGIYTENPKVCKLLILKSPDNPELIIGRALVWTLDNDEVFMDRIYYSYESDVNLFKDYAIKNGWCYKQRQESSIHTTIEWTPEKVRKGDLTVKLEHSYFDDYPYMDTLKYLNERADTISNNDYRSDLTLESTEGGRGDRCENCNGSGRVSCYECDGDGRVDCGRCDGDGEVDCNDCDGSGTISCSRCDGEGQIEGDEEGEMKECPDCNGNGQIDCEECDGNGKIECSRCDGDGRVDCPVCDGDCDVDCPDCS